MNVPDNSGSTIPHSFLPELGFGMVGGLLLFVVLTGIVVWVLPFGMFGQVCVVLHTVVGVAGAVAFAIWQLSHWLAGRASPRTFRKICAYTGFWLLALSVLTGVVIACQAAFGRYMSQRWDSLHLWTGILALPFLVYHVWPAAPADGSDERLAKQSFRRRTWKRATVVAAALSVICIGLTLYCSRAQHNEAQRFRTGDSDFSPSMVDTENSRPIAAEVLAHSDSCGTTDCHAGIYDEWRASAHHWSAEDEFFQEVRGVTTRVKGVHETEKCSACHDPVSMLSGHKDPALGPVAPGFHEGDSCVVCHSVRKVDERGIGSYVLAAPKPYLFDRSTRRYARLLNHFLIRAYPEQHDRDYDLTLARKPESCAPCHKEYDVLNAAEGPVQVETQYDDWKHGKWNTDADASHRLYCQQCHMYAVVSSRAQADPYDLKQRLGAIHRNHSFAAGNQYMPAAISAHNSGVHVERVQQWLRGERAVPEIDKVWPNGPIVELKIVAPQRTKADLNLQVVLSNKKVGHGFPTGPLNIARAWIELVVDDAAGNTVFHSGLLDAENHIEEGSYILKPLAIDTAGHMILKSDLWHPVGPKFRRAILAGESDSYDYNVKLPPNTNSPLTVKARLRYSKANQFFMDAVYPGARRLAPVTDLSSAQIRIELLY